MLHVILKSRFDITGKIKVKVPVRYKTGKMAMGYRYKVISKKKQKQREKYVRDVPLWKGSDRKVWNRWVEELITAGKIEKRLLSPESEFLQFSFDAITHYEEEAEKKEKEADRIEEKVESLEDQLDGIGKDIDDKKDRISKLKNQPGASAKRRNSSHIKFLQNKLRVLLPKRNKWNLKLKDSRKQMNDLRTESNRLERLSEKHVSSELQGHIPGPESLKREGIKAISKSLKKLGLDHLKTPMFSEDIDPHLWRNSKPREWQDDWATTSNDDGEDLCDALQYAMSSRLPDGSYDIPPGLGKLRKGIEKTKIAYQTGNITYKKDAAALTSSRSSGKLIKDSKKVLDMYDNYIKAANVVLDTVYQRTQKILTNLGYSSGDYIYLYRGMDTHDPALQKGRMLNIRKFKHNPLSSWSIDPTVAEEFGNKLLVTKVKVKDIVSVYLTGLGCLNESEILIPASSAGRKSVV